VHERGSHGCSFSTVEVGAAKAPLLPLFPEDAGLVVVVVVLNAPVPVPVPVEVDVPEPAVPVVPVAAAGGLTLKSVPVTTVTWDPGLTWEASSAMITAPDRELATACAAASEAGDLDE